MWVEWMSDLICLVYFSSVFLFGFFLFKGSVLRSVLGRVFFHVFGITTHKLERMEDVNWKW